MVGQVHRRPDLIYRCPDAHRPGVALNYFYFWILPNLSSDEKLQCRKTGECGRWPTERTARPSGQAPPRATPVRQANPDSGAAQGRAPLHCCRGGSSDHDCDGCRAIRVELSGDPHARRTPDWGPRGFTRASRPFEHNALLHLPAGPHRAAHGACARFPSVPPDPKAPTRQHIQAQRCTGFPASGAPELSIGAQYSVASCLRFAPRDRPQPFASLAGRLPSRTAALPVSHLAEAREDRVAPGILHGRPGAPALPQDGTLCLKCVRLPFCFSLPVSDQVTKVSVAQCCAAM